MPKRIGNIWSSICDIENIKKAHRMARKDKSFYEAVQKTDKNLEERVQTISDILKNHTYKVGMYKTSRYKDRGKERVLYKLPYYPDRIIQWAIMLQIEPYFKQVFTDFTCASLPHRGIHQASKLLYKYLNLYPEETKYYLKIDIKKFYPSINRNILKQLLQKKFKDKDLLYELNNIIDSFDNNDSYKLNLSPEEKQIYSRPGYGVPVGSYLSQYLANFYLAYFDHWLKEECGCKFIIRYMDDIIIFSDSKEFLHNLLCAIKIYLKIELDLSIKDNYKISPSKLGVDFVGYRHFRGYKLLRKQTYKRFKRFLTHIKEINNKIWCSIMSMIGWLSWANCYSFVKKYIGPIAPQIGAHYFTNIVGKYVNIFKGFLVIERFKKQYKKQHIYDNIFGIRQPLHAGGVI